MSTPAAPAFSDYHERDDGEDLRTVVRGLDGPRGVDALGQGRTLVTETDGTFSMVVERRHHRPRVIKLGRVPTEFAPAIDTGPHGQVYILTGAAEPGTRGAATLYTWKPGWSKLKVLADIARYQRRDRDPYNVEGDSKESNPFGVAALDDGTVLVADAAGNDLLRVDYRGYIETVARFKPRSVTVPSGLGTRDPEGRRLPRAGTKVKSEAVTTSVTVGDDGYWYVGELRGWPANPGTSQVWRIKPGSVGATCDPAAPYNRSCARYADGLTSIVDLGADDDGSIYALSLSKQSWLRMEMRAPGAQVGGLFEIKRHDDGDYRHHDGRFHDRNAYDRDDDWRGHRDRRYDPRFGDSWHDDGRRDRDCRDHEPGYGPRDNWKGEDDNVENGSPGVRNASSGDPRENRRGGPWKHHCYDGDDWNGDRHRGDDGYRDRHRDGNWYDERDRHRERGDYRHADHRDGYGFRTSIRELVPNQLRMPGGVDVASDGDIYIVGPLFGPGALMKIDD